MRRKYQHDANEKTEMAINTSTMSITKQKWQFYNHWVMNIGTSHYLSLNLSQMHWLCALTGFQQRDTAVRFT